MYKKIKKLILSNIQINQTVILVMIIIIGVQFYGLNLSYLKLLIIFSTTIITDIIFIRIKTGKFHFPFSGLNSGFGISTFLRSDLLIIYLFAGLISILGKNLIRINGRHFFNPSNMGVFVTLILFQNYTWTEGLHWGNYIGELNYKYILIISIIGFLGVFINYRVYEFFKFKYFIDYLAPFFFLHLILFLIIPNYVNVSTAMEYFSVTFFIFMFYMISDPKTVPGKSLSRFFYAINLVLIFYILTFFINYIYALLGSLFISTMQLPLIWYLESNIIKIKNKYNLLNLYFYIITILLIIGLSTLLYINGKPDFIINNICNNLICK
ncbi:MAG: hypothetical protein PHV23_00295 [Candidatus Gracilibacteria bacterium]|nr:hypothetical protein [Candidatus Gracilibacteria bacterium]